MAPTRRNRGILSEPLDLDARPKRGVTYDAVPAEMGLEVTHRATSMIGAVVGWSEQVIDLRDDSGRDHRLRNLPGAFDVDGRPVRLVRPTPAASDGELTASGSIATPNAPARVARASRILVEGTHDAELVEKVWGADLRDLGIVVQPIDGMDDLVEIVRGFRPGPGRRLGILLDHLVEHTKEQRIAEQISHPDVEITGHRFVDIWGAIDPVVIGLDAWPEIPREIEWKQGIVDHAAANGCPARATESTAAFWRHLLAHTSSYKDLDPSLVGAVEALIDFVAPPD